MDKFPVPPPRSSVFLPPIAPSLAAVATARRPAPHRNVAGRWPPTRRPLAADRPTRLPLAAACLGARRDPARKWRSARSATASLHPEPFLPSLRFQESMFLSLDLSLACAVVAFPWRPSSQLISRVPSRCNLTCHAAAPKVPLPIASPASLGDDPSKWDPAECDALLRGGEQVASVLQEMLTLMEDMEMDGAFEPVAVELVAQGVIGKRVDEMESGFLMALDYMIQLAQKDADDERKSLLEVIKQTVLDHLTKKCPPHVQVVGLLCQTEKKESRHELLRRVAAGGGVFKNDKGLKCQIPGANLSDIANQADDLLESMESRDTIPDRKLLARLVIVREEARNMMGGGLLDERNDRGLSTLPEAEVNFLSKLVALKPGKALERMIKDVMNGKGEGADNIEPSAGSHSEQERLTGVLGRGSVSGHKPRPVRPGMFLETVSKVLGGVYASNTSGITAQHLEWVHQTTLKILQEMAF